MSPPVRCDPLRRPEPVQSHRDGAADAQSGQRRAGAERADGAVLPATRWRRADHQRGNAGERRRAGVPRYAGHLQRRAGDRLAPRHRHGASGGRPDRRAAVARRAHLACVAAAGRTAAGVAHGAPGDRQDLHDRRLRGRVDAARAVPRRTSAHRRRLRARGISAPCRPVATAPRCIRPTVTCSNSLRYSINDRNDACGGSIANRTRLLPEVVQAVSDEVGAARRGCARHRSRPSTIPDWTATRRRCSTLWSNSSTR